MTDKTQDDQGDLDSNIFAFIFCRVLAFKIIMLLPNIHIRAYATEANLLKSALISLR